MLSKQPVGNNDYSAGALKTLVSEPEDHPRKCLKLAQNLTINPNRADILVRARLAEQIRI